MYLRCERGTDPLDILDALLPYITEAGVAQGLTFDFHTALHTLTTACTSEYADCFVIKDNLQIAGVIIVWYNSSCFVGYEGGVSVFYVRPEYRGTKTGRMLVEAVVKAKRDRGVNIIYCGCHSDMGNTNNQMFVNLFAKYGFTPNGTNLMLR